MLIFLKFKVCNENSIKLFDDIQRFLCLVYVVRLMKKFLVLNELCSPSEKLADFDLAEHWKCN